MNTATAILRKEHDAILRMLETTEEVAAQLDRGEPVPEETMNGLIEFFRLFADRCHHSKEEDLLFPLLARKGLSQAGGPIMVMLSEHVQGRALIKQMGEAAEAYANGDGGAAFRWTDAARGYNALLRDHIDKENNILFRIAENLLTFSEQRELAAAFERLEEQRMGAGTHERLHALMDTLSAAVRTR